MIAGDNVAFLCELMDEIGRKDLTDEVKSYIERTEGESGMYMYMEIHACVARFICKGRERIPRPNTPYPNSTNT